MTLVNIGPISLGDIEHGNPSWSLGASPSPSGNSPASIGGLLTWTHVKQLRELVNNFDEAETVGESTGVKVDIGYTGDLFAEFSGWYLLTGLNFDPTKASTMSEDTAPFTLNAVYVGPMA